MTKNSIQMIHRRRLWCLGALAAGALISAALLAPEALAQEGAAAARPF